MSDLRIFCCVAGCKRSWKDDGRLGSVICGRHYKMSPRLLRHRFKRLKAAARALLRKRSFTPADALRLDRLYKLEAVMWRRIVAAASGSSEKPAGLDAALAEIGVL